MPSTSSANVQSASPEAGSTIKSALFNVTVGIFSVGVATWITRAIRSRFRGASENRKELLLNINYKNALAIVQDQQAKKERDHFLIRNAYEEAADILLALKEMSDTKEEKGEIIRLQENAYSEIAKASYYLRDFLAAEVACQKLLALNATDRISASMRVGHNVRGLSHLKQALQLDAPGDVAKATEHLKNALGYFQKSLQIDHAQDDVTVFYLFTEQKLKGFDFNECEAICHRIEWMHDEAGLRSEWKAELASIYGWLCDEMVGVIGLADEAKLKLLEKRVAFYNMALCYTPDAAFLQKEKSTLWVKAKLALESHYNHKTEAEKKSEDGEQVQKRINQYEAESKFNQTRFYPQPQSHLGQKKRISPTRFFERPMPIRSDVLTGSLALLTYVASTKLWSMLNPGYLFVIALSAKQQTNKLVDDSVNTIKASMPTLKR